MKYTVATRRSALARCQTDLFISTFTDQHPDVAFTVQNMTTAGDQTMGSIANLKDAFVGELESALLRGEVRCAVHSLKDMSVSHQESLTIGAVLPRHDPRDVFLSVNYACLSDLPNGAIVGTSSARRCAQIKAHHPLLEVKRCRGNVPTRINQLKRGDFDAIVLAVAGVERLGMIGELKIDRLAIDRYTPACGQGAIAIQCRDDDTVLCRQLRLINHRSTHDLVMLEREIVRQFGAHCGMPLGVHIAKRPDDQLAVYVFVGSLDGQRVIQRQALWSNNLSLDSGIIKQFVESVLSAGARDIFAGCQGDL